MTQAVTHDKLLRWTIAALIVATVLAYVPALRAGFIWDDDDYVTENLTLRSAHGLVRIWTEFGAVPQYYPLVHTSYWFEYHLWGLAPFGYHLVNVLLHAGSAVLLLIALRRLSIPGALLAAAMFALHPVQVESVAWITERKNCLSTFFYLLSMLACIDLFNLRETASKQGRGLFLALILFVAALLSKTVTCSLPAAVLLLVYWKRGRIEKREWLLSVPFFVLGAVLSGLTIWMEKSHVGGGELQLGLSGWERCLIAGRAVWFYAGKLVWPHSLAFIYPRWNVDEWSAVYAAYPIAAVALVTALWALRHRIGRGPLVAVLFFGGTLLPALGFIDVYPFLFSFVADHFQYLASIGLIVLTASAAARARERLGIPLEPAAVLAGIILLALGITTFRQARIYHDMETLWRDTLTKNPGSWMPLENLGREMVRQERHEEGLEYYLRAVELRPQDPITRYNLGAVYLQLNRFDEAENQFRRAIDLRADYPDAHANLGVALHQQGDYREAAAQFLRVLEAAPNNQQIVSSLNEALNAMVNQANALAARNRLNEAIDSYEYILSIRPNDADDRFNYAALLQRAGKREEAIGQFEEVLRRNPGDREARTRLEQLSRRP